MNIVNFDFRGQVFDFVQNVVKDTLSTKKRDVSTNGGPLCSIRSMETRRRAIFESDRTVIVFDQLAGSEADFSNEMALRCLDAFERQHQEIDLEDDDLVIFERFPDAAADNVAYVTIYKGGLDGIADVDDMDILVSAVTGGLDNFVAAEQLKHKLSLTSF